VCVCGVCVCVCVNLCVCGVCVWGYLWVVWGLLWFGVYFCFKTDFSV